MARGGHAADAAIAANAVMGVVAPMANGVGGDLFAIVYDAASDRLTGVNASGWAPAGLSVDYLRARGVPSMPQSGIHSVTVPGAVAGWAMLHEDFGRLPLADVLEPAARVAEEGIPVAELIAAEWASSGDAAAVARRDGADVPAGDGRRAPVTCSPTRRSRRRCGRSAARGATPFTRATSPARILALSAQQGGAWVASDLCGLLGRTHRADLHDVPWLDRVRASAERPGHLRPDDAEHPRALPVGPVRPQLGGALHTLIEAKKLAYADMQRHLADPRFSNVPIARAALEGVRARAGGAHRPWRAQSDVGPGPLPEHGGDTTYLTAVDRDGNMVSLIQSNFANFGSGLVPDGLGFALQNRGGLFSLDPGHPNALAPRKRPLHTIIPGFMSHGSARIAFGIMGGWNQSQAHAQFVSNVVDHGMNIQAALEAPRFTKLTFEGCDLTMEDRVPASVRVALSAERTRDRRPGRLFQHGRRRTGVMRDAAAGVNYGASDPRKDGAAIPEPLL